MLLLTQCAVCATELGLSLGKKCGRCSTRYCGAECQVQHWKEGGHDTLCKKIKKAGGAEQYNANEKYAEAVAVAATACADDTKGQTCYICTQALHWKTKEGLVRMCACRGTAGFAHVSCLAEQARILFAEAEENKLDWGAKNPRFRRWAFCSLCEQGYYGVVLCALGWACWKTYVGRPERAQTRRMAMSVLGNGLSAAKRHEESLSVREADLATRLRLGDAEEQMLVVQSNLANAYSMLGREEEALRLKRDVYSGRLTLHGEEHIETLQTGINYAISLFDLGRFEEIRSLLRKTTPVAQRVLGKCNDITLRMRWIYTATLCKDGATLDELHEAVATFEEIERTVRRVYGSAHPLLVNIENTLQISRKGLRRLRAREGDVESAREAVEAMRLGDA